jgi:hypothetical protein
LSASVGSNQGSHIQIIKERTSSEMSDTEDIKIKKYNRFESWPTVKVYLRTLGKQKLKKVPPSAFHQRKGSSCNFEGCPCALQGPLQPETVIGNL